MSTRIIAALILVSLLAACAGETPFPARYGAASPSDGGPYNPVTGSYAAP